MTNEYSDRWFQLFLDRIRPGQTELEVAFVGRQLPQDRFKTVMDLCCGSGRHARGLSNYGYRVTGVERSKRALSEARRLPGTDITYVKKDMRRLEEVPGRFDAVVSLWQSFGYFDESTNRDIVRQVYEKLTPQGRFIIDLYHRAFFEQHQGARSFVRGGEAIEETSCMTGNRLSVRLKFVEADIIRRIQLAAVHPSRDTGTSGGVRVQVLVGLRRLQRIGGCDLHEAKYAARVRQVPELDRQSSDPLHDRPTVCRDVGWRSRPRLVEAGPSATSGPWRPWFSN